MCIFGRFGTELLLYPSRPLDEVLHIIHEKTRVTVTGDLQGLQQLEQLVRQSDNMLLVAKDSSERPITESGSPIFDAMGAVTGFVLVFRDVSIERNLEREREANVKTMQQLTTEYKLLADNLPYLIARFDTKLHCFYANQAALAVGIFSPSLIVGKTIDKLAVPVSIAKGLKDRIRSAFLTGATNSVDTEFPTPSGSRIFHTTLFPEQSSDGSIGTVLLLAHDITNRKRDEEALQKSKEKLRLITDNSRDYIWMMDNHLYTNWLSPSMAKAIGYTLKDLDRISLTRLLSPCSQAVWDRFAVSQLNPERLNDSKADIEIEEEFEFRRKDGSFFWANVSIILLRDENGHASGFLCMGRDITERKKVKEALEISEKRYRRLFEAAKDGILIIDADSGKIVDVNPFLLKLTGYSEKEFIGKNIWEIGTFKDIAASKVAFQKLQTEGYVRYEDLPLEILDGRKVVVEFISNVY